SKNQIKRIISLQQKKYRKELGLFFVEGKKVIQELLDSNFGLEELYVTGHLVDHIPHQRLIGTTDLKKISALSNPNNALTVFRMPEPKKIKAQGVILALDKLRDPGNLATIIRLCGWFGITDLVCSE